MRTCAMVEMFFSRQVETKFMLAGEPFSVLNRFISLKADESRQLREEDKCVEITNPLSGTEYL